jgi:AAA+ ATPase superfamily predicted ATPase
LAVYGRRRVGKTYLIRNFFSPLPCTFFEITGLKNGSLKNQIQLFTEKLDKIFSTHYAQNPPKNWLKAFQLLTECIENKPKKNKIVLFFDELPWLAGKKSGFLQALDYYWNSVWSSRKRLKLLVCGSAASWMLNNL